jgi:hypothetical protein
MLNLPAEMQEGTGAGPYFDYSVRGWLQDRHAMASPPNLLAASK